MKSITVYVTTTPEGHTSVRTRHIKDPDYQVTALPMYPKAMAKISRLYRQAKQK